MKYNWIDESIHVKHYYRTSDGKVLGTVWQFVNNNIIWCGKILEDTFPFTDTNEKYLGRYIDQTSAKESIEKFWQKQDNTLTWEH